MTGCSAAPPGGTGPRDEAHRQPRGFDSESLAGGTSRAPPPLPVGFMQFNNVG